MLPLCLYACRQEERGARTEEEPRKKVRGLGRGEAQSDSSSLALSQMGPRGGCSVDFFFLMLQGQTVFHFEKPELTASSLAYLFKFSLIF